jgi:hypothetical protein
MLIFQEEEEEPTSSRGEEWAAFACEPPYGPKYAEASIY